MTKLAFFSLFIQPTLSLADSYATHLSNALTIVQLQDLPLRKYTQEEFLLPNSQSSGPLKLVPVGARSVLQERSLTGIE